LRPPESIRIIGAAMVGEAVTRSGREPTRTLPGWLVTDVTVALRTSVLVLVNRLALILSIEGRIESSMSAMLAHVRQIDDILAPDHLDVLVPVFRGRRRHHGCYAGSSRR